MKKRGQSSKIIYRLDYAKKYKFPALFVNDHSDI